jgi:hypothetical protein
MSEDDEDGECDVDCGREYEGQSPGRGFGCAGAIAVRCGAMRCLVAGRWLLGRYADST